MSIDYNSPVPPLEVALQLHALNYPVFPCDGRRIPIVVEWPDRNYSEAELRTLWSRNPEALTGIVTGKRSGLFVLDIDRKGDKNGFLWLNRMPPLPRTVTVETPNGGLHYYFAYPGRRVKTTAGQIAPGVDVRGDGGYIIAPGSCLPDGRSYRSNDYEAIAEAPPWLLDLVTAPERTLSPTSGSVARTAINDPERYGAVALQKECERIENAGDGEQNDVLNRSAFAVGRLVRDGFINRDAAETALNAAGLRMINYRPDERWSDRQVAYTVKRSLDDAMRQPVQIEKIDFSLHFPGPFPALPEGAIPIPPDRAPTYDLPIVSLAELDGKPVPRRRWIVEGLIPDRTITDLSADGGMGKSLLAFQLAIAMATDSDWLGMRPAAGPVLFLSAEDEYDELHRRAADIRADKGLQFSDTRSLEIIDLAGSDATLASPDAKKMLTKSALFHTVESYIVRTRPKLIVLDTRADVFGGNEIDRLQVRQFISFLRGWCFNLDCAVLLISHPSITGISTGSGQSGSTAWGNSVRSRLYLERIEDGKFLQLTTKKQNYGKLGVDIKLRWDAGVLKAVSSSLNPFDNADRERIVDDLFIKALIEVNRQGRNVSGSYSGNYAPKIFAEHVRVSASKKELEQSMNRLLAANRIMVVETGPKSKKRKYLVINDCRSPAISNALPSVFQHPSIPVPTGG